MELLKEVKLTADKDFTTQLLLLKLKLPSNQKMLLNGRLNTPVL
jgi:hypothetical protein